MCAQPRLKSAWASCPVWSESSLSAWRKFGSLATHWVHSEDSDLTWAYSHFVGFVMKWLKLFQSSWFSERILNTRKQYHFCKNGHPYYRHHTCFFMHKHMLGTEEAVWTRDRMLSVQTSSEGSGKCLCMKKRVLAILAFWYDSTEKCHRKCLEIS